MSDPTKSSFSFRSPCRSSPQCTRLQGRKNTATVATPVKCRLTCQQTAVADSVRNPQSLHCAGANQVSGSTPCTGSTEVALPVLSSHDSGRHRSLPVAGPGTEAENDCSSSAWKFASVSSASPAQHQSHCSCRRGFPWIGQQPHNLTQRSRCQAHRHSGVECLCVGKGGECNSASAQHLHK